MSETPTNNHPALTTACLLTLVCAGILIAAGARGDLWLDEIHSLAFIEQASSASQVFTSFRSDNNHILNTLWLYLLGPGHSFFSYRLLAVTCGIGSLLTLWRLAQPAGRLAVLFTLALAGSSYPLALYFSEARGYAPALFCSLLAFLLLRRCREQLSSRNVVFFWIVTLLGLVAHSTFVIILVSLAGLSLYQEISSSAPLAQRAKRLLLLYSVPMLGLAALYLGFIAAMTIGGGDRLGYTSVIGRAVALLTGLPDSQPWVGLALAAYLAIVIGGTFIHYRQGSCEWPFYPLALLICPLLMLAVTRPEVLYFRYFLVCFPFFYLLLGSLLAKVSRTRIATAAVAVLILLIAAGQLARLTPFMKYGRGSYQAALNYMAQHTPGAVISIGSDHDYRNGMLVSFYGRHLVGGKQVRFINRQYLQQAQPEWIITHTQDLSYKPETVLLLEGVGRYSLKKVYPFAGDSGWNWMVYRRE